MQGLHHRELLDGFVDLATATHTSGIDNGVLFSATLEVDVDGIARRARLIEGDDALFAQDGVDQGGLADVGTTHDDQFRVGRFFFGLFFERGQLIQRETDHLSDVITVRR